MKKTLISTIAAGMSLLMLAGCSKTEGGAGRQASFEQISAEEAKNIMDTESGYIIVDVRTPEEYEEGHIQDAILLPDYEIGEKAEETFSDKEQLLLVYCRSGRRSKGAARELASMGYTNVKEFGGIIDWPYEVVR